MRPQALRPLRPPRRPTPEELDLTASGAPPRRGVVLVALVLALAVSLTASSAGEPIRGRLAWTRTTQQADAGWIEVTELPGLSSRLVTPRSRGVSRRFDTQAAWAPSGKGLAFTRRNAGAASGVYVVSSTGGAARRVARISDSARWDTGLSWSPDGHSVVLVRSPDCSDKRTQLHLTVVDVRNARATEIPVLAAPAALAEVFEPRWSPRGDRLLYLLTKSEALDRDDTCLDYQNRSSVYVVAANGRGRRLIASGIWLEQAEWSPDGKRIAFLDCSREESYPDDGTQWYNVCDLVIADADGPGRRRIRMNLPRGSIGFSMRWMPDGREVLLVHDDRLISVNTSTGRRRLRLAPKRGFFSDVLAVSSDGRSVALQGAIPPTVTVWFASLVSGREKTILVPDDATRLMALAVWMP
jgi:dipeptidyl aminopeptidase/acylaminoacyl peptidase